MESGKLFPHRSFLWRELVPVKPRPIASGVDGVEGTGSAHPQISYLNNHTARAWNERSEDCYGLLFGASVARRP